MSLFAGFLSGSLQIHSCAGYPFATRPIAVRSHILKSKRSSSPSNYPPNYLSTPSTSVILDLGRMQLPTPCLTPSLSHSTRRLFDGGMLRDALPTVRTKLCPFFFMNHVLSSYYLIKVHGGNSNSTICLVK